MNVGEFLTDTLEPLWKMTAAGSDAPLLLDRGAKLTPVTDGFQLPDFYHWLLFPFSQRPVSGITCCLYKFTNGCLTHCSIASLRLNSSRFPTSTTGCCFPSPSAQ